MDTQTLLIADSSEPFRLALVHALSGRYRVLCCGNGREALELLLRENCALLVLDLMLPELDGITLVEQAALHGCHPRTLATTRLLTSYIEEAAPRVGIGYLMRKPVSVTAVVARLQDLAAPASAPPEPAVLVSRLLHSLGVSTLRTGGNYLLLAIPFMSKDPTQCTTKVLYPILAKRFQRTPGSIERAIRTALLSAWDIRDPAVWSVYFPDATRCPTNNKFLIRMAQALNRLLDSE